MSQYLPPTEELAIFNPSNYPTNLQSISNSVNITQLLQSTFGAYLIDISHTFTPIYSSLSLQNIQFNPSSSGLSPMSQNLYGKIETFQYVLLLPYYKIEITYYVNANDGKGNWYSNKTIDNTYGTTNLMAYIQGSIPNISIYSGDVNWNVYQITLYYKGVILPDNSNSNFGDFNGNYTEPNNNPPPNVLF